MEFGMKDHPRLCGEKGFIKNETMIWGRITPAYAGKSRRITSSFSSIRDHPRLCGEKGMVLVFHLNSLGSPPPMRGKASDGTAVAGGIRITPAYAGKRSSHGSCTS